MKTAHPKQFAPQILAGCLLVAAVALPGCGSRSTNNTEHAVTMTQVENNAPGLKQSIQQENQNMSASSQAMAARAKAAGR